MWPDRRESRRWEGVREIVGVGEVTGIDVRVDIDLVSACVWRCRTDSSHTHLNHVPWLFYEISMQPKMWRIHT